MKFLAIDFETADYQSDSACAVGMVRVEEGKIVKREFYLIRPPRAHIHFTYLHGIGWDDVKDQPDFSGVWPKMEKMMEGVDFLVAHNASFDKGVLTACCYSAGIKPPQMRFECTLKTARKVWGIYPTNLPAVCRHFGIPLNHHDAASDTEACAQIMIRALQTLDERRSGSAMTAKEPAPNYVEAKKPKMYIRRKNG